ncbi:DUF3775 domain-containing protein [Octadecabacter sp. 1_MG-2023]|uniref:DUF3775 domain-containing protein n=1 Tax=unclassified Octadecabacter TaxID=196158 RepID=UPI001C083C15|nr:MULTISPECIES: DUF3775 domain-containing protein [unclassified Octadecabacter]MBU2992098.1 DUF3775 domain-containing protein [Octadecabacter sp. B2R22]MDO6735145.1 DUF3775 domain-containing protein [Octadecabacter sp. 1_MG-2023]
MLKINTDKIAEIIILARDTPRGEREFDAFVSGLDEEEQASLVAVMWIGRGSFDALEYAEAYNTAVTEASTPTEDYLKGSPHLADHLENGLDALGISAAAEEDDLY